MARNEYKPDKTRFKDSKGRYIVQGLFLEDSYNTELAVYTLDGEDKTYKGVVYPSLKKLYIEEGDPEEWSFVQKYLFDWDHWLRLKNNKIMSTHISKWREELTISLRSEGMLTLIDLAVNDRSYQAAKYLADEGFIKKPRGRPSQKEIDAEVARNVEIAERFSDDFQLLTLHKEKK